MLAENTFKFDDYESSFVTNTFYIEKDLGAFVTDDYPLIKLLGQFRELKNHYDREKKEAERGKNRLRR